MSKRRDREIRPLRQHHHLRIRGHDTWPDPNGQIPAMARNSVDLPEPDGPLTSTRSRG